MSLHRSHPRPALGCMRLSTDADRHEGRARAVIEAAYESGVRVFDTARAYARDDGELGHNERWLRAALEGCDDVAIVSKGGMRRPRGAWRPDGRAKTVRADAEASAEALGRPVDLWLLHSLDPRVAMKTSVRAMRKVLDDGTAKTIGICNVDRTRLDEALELAPLTAVQVALSPRDTTALRGGVVERCAALDLTLMAHSPFGGPERAPKLGDKTALGPLAEAHGESAHRLALAWLMALSPCVVPVPGARRVETAAACGSPPELPEATTEALAQALPDGRFAGPRVAPPQRRAGEVVLLMGLAGAGKTTAVERFVKQGYTRLNRDLRGGTLRQVAEALREAIAGGADHLVLDNTYLGRASRAQVIAAAWDGGLPARCVFVDTPPNEVRHNLCVRLLERFGELPEPDVLRTSKQPGVFAPTTHQSMVRRLEPPALDEGFEAVERAVFERLPTGTQAGLVVAVDHAPAESTQPTLELGWSPGATETRQRQGMVERAVCPHAAGPPRCWCRPPMPGLVVRWARESDVDLRRVMFEGGGAAFRTLAAELGATHRD